MLEFISHERSLSDAYLALLRHPHDAWRRGGAYLTITRQLLKELAAVTGRPIEEVQRAHEVLVTAERDRALLIGEGENVYE